MVKFIEWRGNPRLLICILINFKCYVCSPLVCVHAVYVSVLECIVYVCCSARIVAGLLLAKRIGAGLLLAKI